jgi:hypothetical protein
MHLKRILRAEDGKDHIDVGYLVIFGVDLRKGTNQSGNETYFDVFC